MLAAHVDYNRVQLDGPSAEIMPLEDVPRKFTKQVHLRLHTAHVKPEQLESVQELIRRLP